MIISELTPHITHDAARESCRCPIGAVTTGSAVTLAFTDGLSSVLDAELVLYGDGFEHRYEMALEDGRWYVRVTMPEEAAALWYVSGSASPKGNIGSAQARAAASAS